MNSNDDKLKAIKISLVKANRLYLKTENDVENKSELPQFKNWEKLSMSSKLGHIVYNSFDENELIYILRDSAYILNHSPSQKEILPILREYIKCKFGKWPYALKAAGLAKNAGADGKSFNQMLKENEEKTKLLNELAELTKSLGYLPYPSDAKELAKKLAKYYDTWGKCFEDAKVDDFNLGGFQFFKVEQTAEIAALLEQVKNLAYELHRPPLLCEIDDAISSKLVEHCVCWANVLYQIDLPRLIQKEPFKNVYLDYRNQQKYENHAKINISKFYFKVVNPEAEFIAALKRVEDLYKFVGVFPKKNDVDKNDRKILISYCITWNNVAFQILNDFVN